MVNEKLIKFLKEGQADSTCNISRKDLEQIVFYPGYDPKLKVSEILNIKQYTLKKTHPILPGQKYVSGKEVELNTRITEYDMLAGNTWYFHLMINDEDTIKHLR